MAAILDSCRVVGAAYSEIAERHAPSGARSQPEKAAHSPSSRGNAMITPFHLQASKEKPRVYKPVWRCIYCGSTVTLSKEHIIAGGLGGNTILPKSSCEKCRKMTQEFETVCLRSNFFYYRIHTGLQRHANERPEGLPLRIGGRDGLVAPTAHPNLLILPRMLEPGILSGAPLGMFYVVKWGRFGDAKALEEIINRHGAPISVDYNFNITQFVRMLAKIAHGFICAELNERDELKAEIFRPFLPDFIRGINFDLGPYLVGQSNKMLELPIDRFDLHQTVMALFLERDRCLVSVGVRLFSNWRGLVYCVIAGELLAPPPHFLARYGLSSVAPRIREVLRRRRNIASDPLLAGNPIP
jgi:hypothetical protein